MANSIRIKTKPYPEEEYKKINYEQRDDGWYIKKEDEEEFRKYAMSNASERTVRQLINKDFDLNYGGSWEDDE